MPDELIPDYLRRAQSDYVAPENAEPEPPADVPSEGPIAPSSHTPQWQIEFPQGCNANDSIAKIDRYLALKMAWLNDLLSRWSAEQEGDERLLNPDKKIHKPAQEYYKGRHRSIQTQFRAFAAEQKVLGVGKKDSVRQRKVRAEQRAANKSGDDWIARTAKDYKVFWPDDSTQKIKSRMEADKKAAQGGDLEAYIRLNGFTTGDENARLELDPAHHDMIRCYTSDLRCKGCGKPHGGELREQNADGSLKGPECPHCGLENCHGPMNSKMKAPRGLGKTEIEAHDFAMRVGMMLQRGRWPRAVVLGDQDKEAKVRTAMVTGIMNRPGHTYVFDRELPPLASRPHNFACRPKPTHTAGAVTFFGRKDPVIVAYGFLGMPPGYHADLFWCDDCVNYKNTFLKPGFIKDIIDAWLNVVCSSKRPWTHLTWTGTPWLGNDLDAVLEKEAEEDRDQWDSLTIACGGPENDFWTPSEKQLSRAFLKQEYERQQRSGGMSYDRAYRMRVIDASRVAFRDFHYYVHSYTTDGPPYKDLIEEAKIPILRGIPKDMKCPKLLAIDVGFTSATSEKKGRSKTALVYGGLSENFAFVQDTFEDYLDPSQVRAMPVDWCKRFGCKDVVCALGPGMEDYVQHYMDNGLTVHRISESQLGNKELRKMPIADTHNAGLVRFRAWPRIRMEKNKSDNTKRNVVEVGPVSEVLALDEACRMYPAEVRDVLDAYEFWRRQLWELYNPTFAPTEKPAEETVEVNPVAAYEDALYASHAKPKEDEAVDPMAALAGRLLDFSNADGEFGEP